MTVDKEQVRRDAERVIGRGSYPVSEWARRWLALDAELEQAERVSASVPALVEAALQVLDNTASGEVHKEARRALAEALIVYEQSQGKP